MGFLVGTRVVFQLGDQQWLSKGKKFVEIDHIEKVKGPRVIITDFNGALVKVENINAEKKYASFMLEKQLRERGETDGASKVVLIDGQKSGNGTSAFYTAVPLDLFNKYETMVKSHSDHTILIPLASLMYKMAKKQGKGLNALLFQHQRSIDLLIVNNQLPVSALRVTSTSDEDFDWIRSMNFLVTEMKHISSQVNEKFDKISWLDWNPQDIIQAFIDKQNTKQNVEHNNEVTPTTSNPTAEPSSNQNSGNIPSDIRDIESEFNIDEIESVDDNNTTSAELGSSVAHEVTEASPVATQESVQPKTTQQSDIAPQASITQQSTIPSQASSSRASVKETEVKEALQIRIVRKLSELLDCDIKPVKVKKISLKAQNVAKPLKSETAIKDLLSFSAVSDTVADKSTLFFYYAERTLFFFALIALGAGIAMNYFAQESKTKLHEVKQVIERKTNKIDLKELAAIKQRINQNNQTLSQKIDYEFLNKIQRSLELPEITQVMLDVKKSKPSEVKVTQLSLIQEDHKGKQSTAKNLSDTPLGFSIQGRITNVLIDTNEILLLFVNNLIKAGYHVQDNGVVNLEDYYTFELILSINNKPGAK